MLQTANAILVTPNDEIIMQQRDNKPEIENPGMISFFGGGIENKETAEQAIIRELKEELNYEPKIIIKFGVYNKTLAKHGKDVKVNMFLVSNVNVNDSDIREGSNYIIISKDDNLNNYNFSKISIEILRDYFKKT